MFEHPVFHVGMLADDLVALMKRTGRINIAKPKAIGIARTGFIVQWYLQDVTLTLGRENPIGPYSITQVLPPSTKKEAEDEDAVVLARLCDKCGEYHALTGPLSEEEDAKMGELVENYQPAIAPCEETDADQEVE